MINHQAWRVAPWRLYSATVMSVRDESSVAPCLTGDLPGVGGRLREQLEDFLVEELPLYEFSGAGQHALLLVEKTGISTTEAARRLARALGVRERDLGFAGHKDARAVTRQWFSVPRVPLRDVWTASAPGLRVLDATLHRNRLKAGHLLGNRFEIVLRGVGAGAADRARAVLEVLARRGVPNYFGEQRFGARGDSDLVGRELVRGSARGALERLLGSPRPEDADRAARERFAAGDYRGALERWPRGDRSARKALAMLAGGARPEVALGTWPKRLRFLFVSACQSRLFNAVLAARLAGIDSLLEGDLAYLHRNGAVFAVRDPAAEGPRAARFEISPSGPMFGYKVLLASGRPGEIERSVLADSGLELEGFRGRLALKARGERRALRVPLRDPEVTAFEDDGQSCLRLGFGLPAGSFATAVLAEIMKPHGTDG
jgi:tRNA pseudouridine13 synthase